MIKLCFVENNKITPGIESIITEPEWKKTRIFNTLPVVRGCRPGRQPIYIIHVLLVHRVVSLVRKFSLKIQIVLLLLYSKNNI